MLVLPLTALWFVLAVLQAIDLAATWAASRSSGRASRKVWAAAGAAVVFVAGTAAVGFAMQQLPDGNPLLRVAALLIAFALVCGGLVTIVLVYERPRVDGLTALETGIRSFDGVRVEKADVSALRAALDAADVARLDHAHPRAWWRWIPAVVGLAVLVLAIVAISAGAAWGSLWWLGIVALVPVVLSVLARFAEVRLRHAVRARRKTEYSARRQALVTELEQLERRASRGVAGLTERVSRALTILREQDRRK
ncbi:MAG: hypothetical protein V4479_14140 [Actinomycetota bacterium]